jgi:hypothetical protein
MFLAKFMGSLGLPGNRRKFFMKHSSLVFASFLLFGCASASNQTNVNVVRSGTEVPELISPAPMDIQEVLWESCGNKLCVSVRDFEKIQNNNLEAARFIRSQRELILYYQNLLRSQPGTKK